jgi:hypothetical protein
VTVFIRANRTKVLGIAISLSGASWESLGISVRTLENWEQKRRIPKVPARVLLEVAAAHPDAVWDVVRHASKDRKRAMTSENRAS